MVTTDSSSQVLLSWDPARYLRRIDANRIKLSRGFLQSHPEKWFPNFGAQWLPLTHALGVEVRVVEVDTSLSIPRNLDYGYSGSIDGEGIGLFFDAPTGAILQDAILAGGEFVARQAVLEYFAIRFLVSLGIGWSGSQTSKVTYEYQVDAFGVDLAGAIRLGVLINNNLCNLWIGLPFSLVDKIDNLWRKQIRSSTRKLESLDADIEIGALAVSPAVLMDYIRPGTVIDLEIPISDSVTLVANNKPWMKGRLFQNEDKMGIEILAGPPTTYSVPPDSTRVSFILGSMLLDAQGVVELSQPHSMVLLDNLLSSSLSVIVNGEKVAEGSLCCYEGRFAVSVS